MRYQVVEDVRITNRDLLAMIAHFVDSGAQLGQGGTLLGLGAASSGRDWFGKGKQTGIETQAGEKGQRPGHGNQPRHADPLHTQAGHLLAPARADRIAIHPLCPYARALAPLQRLVDCDHHRPLRGQPRDQQTPTESVRRGASTSAPG
ncbi:hypothetical protein CKO36_17520 [Rhabdochromatium marinum]|nr:hypothetical protein [Rhabdochromatium marinum]